MIGFAFLTARSATINEDIMTKPISRRKFLQLSGAGVAVTAVLTGCGPAARYVVRKPYYEMPEYAKLGESTYYATTCRECPAGCGIIMRTMEGRAIKAEGNPNHPISRGKICSRGLTSVQGLYNPDRVVAPLQRGQRGQAGGSEAQWETAITAVADALQNNGGQAAFLMGLGSDHLFDLVTEIAQATGAPEPTRTSVGGLMEGRGVLLGTTFQQNGDATIPYFDIANADLVLSFGSDFMSTWMSPVAYGRAFGAFRRFNNTKQRGYLVSFEPRMGVTSGAADEWVPIVPGSEGLVALAIQRIAREAAGGTVNGVDIATVVQSSGVSEERLRALGERWAQARSPLALVGGSALSHANAADIAAEVLSLNAERVNQPGGMYLMPGLGGGAGQPQLPGMFNQVADLVSRMNAGQVQVLFIHGANPVFELPSALGFTQALANVPLVISFSSFPDETALQADWVLPDHTGLESFGYQRPMGGGTQQVVSAVQPVVVPLYNTRATADVLIAAANQAGLNLPYQDEVDFMQQKLGDFIGQGGSIDAPDINVFWSRFLQQGGWWGPGMEVLPVEPDGGIGDGAGAPAVDAGAAPVPLDQPLNRQPAPILRAGDGQYHLVTFTNHLGDGSGANRPWLQETPDPMTTVTWNAWVEINPHTAEELGIHHDDMVRIRSAAGEIELPAYVYPAIRPDTIAIPFGQGHTALGRFAEGRGANPMTLVEIKTNDAGDLAYGDTLVTIEKTGRRRPLARMESLKGVYGEH